jgi:hypothetical protein
VEETMTVSAAGPVAVGQDILVALYPRTADEVPPRYESLAPGVVRIVTAESTDTVFLGADPIEYQAGGIRFRGRAGAVREYPDALHLVIGEGPAEISFGDVTVASAEPVTWSRTPRTDGEPATVQLPATPHDIRFAVDRPEARSETIGPGVRRWTFAGGNGWEFDCPDPITVDRDGVTFHGTRGGVLVDDAAGRVELTLLTGERIGYQGRLVWGDAAPCTVTYTHDGVTGRTAGLNRFLYLTRPPGLDRLPTLVVDGRTYAAGTSADFARGTIAKTGDPYDPDGRGGALIVPVLTGDHRFELRALDQPPVFRNWQAWP